VGGRARAPGLGATRRLEGIVCAAAVAAALVLAWAAPPAFAHQGTPGDSLARAAAPKGPLDKLGRWITDRSGRVVILHGTNMVYKRPPYQPAAVGFGADDAAFLERNGLKTVRLGAIAKAIEPQPGRYNEAYIERLRTTERVLGQHGVFSMIDFHQDLYNEKFGGEGWPDWAVLDDGLPPDPMPGFPATYLTSPGLNRAFDNFWANKVGPGGVPLQSRYAAAWARVARSFSQDQNVLGYDLLNEPWPGTAFASCANTAGCPAFDTNRMAPFYRKVIARIRGEDKRHLVFYEPHVLFNFGADTSIPQLAFRGLGFSFHDYCLVGLVQGAPRGCDQLDESVFDHADAHAARTGNALLLSEFGATDDVAELTRIANLADRHRVSWQHWHYCGCDDPTTSGPGDIQALVKDPARPPRGTNVFWGKLRALARPYPQAIAGVPLRYSFEPLTGRFELVYRTTLPGGRQGTNNLTDVFLPAIQYPHGYLAKADGGSLARVSDGRHLVVRANPGAERVTVTVTKR
jgi:endoglycosylceramidase